MAANQVIFREGEAGDDAYILESGRIEISMGEGDAQRVIAVLEPGEIFGEMALIANAPRSATATTIEPCTLLVLRRNRLMKPIETADPIMRLTIQMMVERLNDASRWKAGQPLISQGSEAQRRAFAEVRELALRRVRTERELRRAIEKDELTLHYQPIVGIADGSLAGYEALMRWHHPEQGFVPPARFIPLAEESGMVVQMGRWALERGLQEHAAIVAVYRTVHPGQPPPFISINVSAAQLHDLSEIDRFAGIIEATGVEPDQIKLEITESLMADDPEHAAEALGRLKDLGVTLAIDDFGTGYSSLSYLHRFPLDTLKIDRSFVSRMDHDMASRLLVRAIVDLAADLGLQTVAEGVETEAEYAELAELGCDFGQGYLMARPCPASDLRGMLAQAGPDWRGWGTAQVSSA
ncbi:MAG: hypothetical protein TEF_18105 [Rhizobiales bacterium NRL2]|jgi:EAL domain-containing protein (putative c-di-GMP-specific phosphodiesterase class I)|nr:MAG: hypothetical protein TEF_18105 [Rhizobiales bacterium NRL2]